MHYSLERVPELAGLSFRHRLTMIMYYNANHPPEHSPTAEGIVVGSIIFGLIAGLFGGAYLFKNPTWGPVAGGLISLAAVGSAVYLCGVGTRVQKFRIFLRQDHSRLLLKLLREDTATVEVTPSAEQNASPAHPLSQARPIETLRAANLNISRGAEVLELCGEVTQTTLVQFQTAAQTEQDAFKALKRLNVPTFFRLLKEANVHRQSGYRALRHSGQLFTTGETNLQKAQALLSTLGKLQS